MPIPFIASIKITASASQAAMVAVHGGNTRPSCDDAGALLGAGGVYGRVWLVLDPQ